MAFEDFKTKRSLTIVYTGDGKGKTTAALGLMVRALGTGWRVAFIQFIKHWKVGEHKFIHDIQKVYKDKLMFYKGGKGFYKAGELSAKDISEEDHRREALKTYEKALQALSSGEYQLVICDEINNAINDGLLKEGDLVRLIESKHPDTSLCITGRNFPSKLLHLTDIATDMTKLKHHFDDKFLANEGIDY